MKRSAWTLLLLLASCLVLAQYPHVRSFEVRNGQQYPHISSLAEDADGLLWLATDLGLLRTDGEFTEVILPAEGRQINALATDGRRMLVAWNDGLVSRCDGEGCDTLLVDTVFKRFPLRALAFDGQGDLWLATYGAGVCVLHNGKASWLTAARGLNDDHVNDLCPVGDDLVAVATDQGIAVCSHIGVLRRIREQEGLPDNLVLSLAAGAGNRLWAGTDRGGALSFDPRATRPRVQRLDSAWQHGPVNSILVDRSVVWTATPDRGVVACDVQEGLATYLPSNAAVDVGGRALDLIRSKDGALLWCDGSDRVYRADPDVLLVPRHEDRDLRHITALCSDRRGRIWFATADGVFRHGAAFADRIHLDRAPIDVGATTPVACIRADAGGSIWVGTVGNGVFRVDSSGRVTRFTEQDGLANNSVLGIRLSGGDVWFATLGGLGVRRADGRFERPTMPGSGFVYDVLPLPDGDVLAATDGTGVVRIDRQGKAARVPGRRDVESFYSLALDGQGRAWACGPGTGICQVTTDSLVCHGVGSPAFDANVFGITTTGGRVVVLGANGLALYDPDSAKFSDLGGAIGLFGIDAELNTITRDPTGAIWLACDKGLVRVAPDAPERYDHVQAVVLSVEAGGSRVPFDSLIDLRYDENFIRFRFAGPYYAAPGRVRFEYRLTGYDPTIRSTRDREVSFARLPPGRYVFEVRAFLADGQAPDKWTAVPFVVHAPWYRTPWAVLAMALAVVSVLLVVLRSREARIRYRDRVEKEKARFQLDALRSQVNPHFLFNSFNTLIELIEEDRTKAVEHVEHLSEFFRNILQVRDKELIPVREELRLLDTYFFLEQRRFGERIALRTTIPDELRDLLLPPLTLQLLVENAIKHNAATRNEPLVVEVSASGQALEVANPFRPRKAAAPSTGFGVQSIRQRYAALTDRPVEVTNDGAYFRVRIPLLNKP
jgi:ligand-binding sensor domain-containing protein